MILEFENQIEIFEEALVMSAGRALVRRAGAFDDTAAMQATPLGWLFAGEHGSFLDHVGKVKIAFFMVFFGL